MSEARRTDPKLWEEVKREITEGGKGGEPGQWSARKAQMAVQEYKRRGGGYDEEGGASKEDTHLHEWTAEDWGTKSGEESGESGERYLPRRVRMLLTEDEYRRSTEKKRDGSGQFVDQPDDVREKVSAIRDGGPTKAMLDGRAADLGIEGRSSMSKDELLAAIEDATDDQGRREDGRRGDDRRKEGGGDLSGRSKDELMDMARERDVEGRSNMSKDELVEALEGSGDGPDDLGGKTKDDLMEMARERDVEGRSSMSKDELVRALRG